MSPRMAVTSDGTSSATIAVSETRVRSEARRAAQPLGVLGQEGVNVGRARLLLPLHEELDVHRQAAVGGQQVPDGRDLEVDLALVVGGTAGVQAAVAHGRLERRGARPLPAG